MSGAYPSIAQMERAMNLFHEYATTIHKYDPKSSNWQKVHDLADAAQILREEISTFLRSPSSLQELKGSGMLDRMKELIPETAKEEISCMKIEDFVGGILYQEPHRAFVDIYQTYDFDYCKELSLQARKQEDIEDTTFTYGEILFFPFASVLHWIFQQDPLLSNSEATFYDLGSGSGKAVIAAALLFDFKRAVGIEFLKPIVKFSKKRAAALNSRHTDSILAREIKFVHGTVLDIEWQEASVAYCHGTCFSDRDWKSISLAAEKLRQGSFVITISKVLSSALFEVVKSEQIVMSWGMASVYIHRRRKIGRWASQILRGGRASRLDLLQSYSNSKCTEESTSPDET